MIGAIPLLLASLLSLNPPSGVAIPELLPHAMPVMISKPRMLPVRFDCAGPHTTSAPGAVRIGAETHAPGFAWFDGLVRDGEADGVTDPWFADWTEGFDATLVIAVQPPDHLYTITLGLGSPKKGCGAVDVVASDSLVATGVETVAGKRKEIRFTVPARQGRLPIRLIARGCDCFTLADVAVSGPESSSLALLFPAVTSVREMIPDPSALGRPAPDSTRALVRRLARFLVENEPNDGNFSYWGLWYQTSFAVRGLLAAGILLDEPLWREAAFRTVDRFAAEQRASGGWAASFFGPDSCLAAASRDSASTNLADVGTMASCLALAAPSASPERRERWLAAARLYADRVVLPDQLPSGAFPNRKWMGKDSTYPYSIATATQCTNLMILGAVTGEAKYTRAAESAAAWLARSVMDDGRLSLSPHDSPNAVITPSTKFGELFYVIEALTWVRELTADPNLRIACREALDRWLFGAAGVRAGTTRGYWWKPLDNWNNSKMAGIPWILAADPRRGTLPLVDNWLERSIAWLADPARAQLIGVGAHPSSPRGEYALAATGFALMGVTSALDASVLRPAAR